MRLLRILFLILLFCSIQVSAGYVNDELLFEENFSSPDALAKWKNNSLCTLLEKGGPNGLNAVKFTSEKPVDRMMTLAIDPQKIKGLVQLEAMVKGENIERAEKGYLGTKMMLSYTDSKEMTRYPEPERQLGTYDWKKVKLIVSLPADTKAINLSIGIQSGTGTYYVADIKIFSCHEGEVQTNSPRENKEAASIPRGDFKGAQYRGVMSGNSLGEEDFATLKEWGANLMRFQFSRKKTDISTPEKYLEWIDSEIARLDSVLPIARKNGIKIAIDLHVGPGTKINEVASNVLVDGKADLDTLTEAWRRIAAHYKGNPDIYGYDLLNEPVVDNYVKGVKNPWQFISEHLVKEIRKVDPETPIITEPDFDNCEVIDAKNIIYSPHFYSPHSYTHQGVLSQVKWSYPGEINGTYWDKEQLRVSMKSVIEFQKKYKVKIFVGEFSAATWAAGADQYIKDCIELFEEYGWDWTYHAFREWPGWSVEYEGSSPGTLRPSPDNPRKRVLLEGLRKNMK